MGTLTQGTPSSGDAGSQLPAVHTCLLPPVLPTEGENGDMETQSSAAASPEKRLRRSQHSSVNDKHTLIKTERMAVRRSLDHTGINSFTSLSNSQIETRVSKLGVSLGRDAREVRSSVVSLKNIEVDRLSVLKKLRNRLPPFEGKRRMTILMQFSTTFVVHQMRTHMRRVLITYVVI